MDGSDFERIARDRLDADAYRFYAGGADDEVTLADNERSWQRLRLRPRVLRGVATADTATTLMGSAVAAPIGIAPTAAHELAHADAECATAAGAAAAGAVYVISTMATRTMEDIAAAVPTAVRWFQLYVRGSLEPARELAERAAASGCRALVVTVDVPTLGLRRHEKIQLDERVGLAHLTPRSQGGLQVYDRHVALTLDDLREIISWTSLPVLAKGVLRADDAVACVRAGVAGVIVSNHGGRQLDTAVAPPTALAEIAAAVGDAAEVYVDGGIRRGTDVLKAVALGAHGALVGRPVLWGLTADGADGVRAVLDGLRDELARAMTLCGTGTIDDITPDLVVGA
jgi:4-hydroxymandelate oxidase